MIKYIDKPEERLTIAILENTKYDAVNKIRKAMRNTNFFICHDKYNLPSHFKVVLHCDPKDVYDKEEGHRRAKKILMDNYHNSFHKRLDMFKEELKNLNGFVSERID